MNKECKVKNNYLFNYQDIDKFKIIKIITDKNFIIIELKYKINNSKNELINYKDYKSYIEDSFYKYFSSGDLKIIKHTKKDNIYISIDRNDIKEIYQK